MASSDDLQPIYAVRAEAVPLLIEAFEFGPSDYRIRLRRGIGWVPVRYKSKEEVLRQLLNMKSYGVNEARCCKKICKPEPIVTTGQ